VRVRLLCGALILLATVCNSAHGAEIPLAIPDITLLNQRGQPVHLASELVGGGVAVVNFVFTNCSTICPPLGVKFSRLQKVLDDRGDQRVRLVSITVDPAMDSPARLLKWANQFQANSRWTLLTGTAPDVYRALKAFGVYTPDKFSHTPIAVIVNARGQSVRVNGLTIPAEDLAKQALDMMPPETAKAVRKGGGQ
jgi:protein SCO1/2